VLDAAGGSAVGSDDIYQEVVKVQQAGKPVVVSMGNLAASGGYYISGWLLSSMLARFRLMPSWSHCDKLKLVVRVACTALAFIFHTLPWPFHLLCCMQDSLHSTIV